MDKYLIAYVIDEEDTRGEKDKHPKNKYNKATHGTLCVCWWLDAVVDKQCLTWLYELNDLSTNIFTSFKISHIRWITSILKNQDLILLS